MFSSKTLSRDSFTRVPADGHFLKTGSDFFQTQNLTHSTQVSQTSGLARYRSAPSSLFAALLNSDTDNSSSGDDEAEAMFSAFLNESPRDLNRKIDDHFQLQYAMKQETGLDSETRPGFSSGNMGYEGAVVGSYGSGVESQVRSRFGNGNGNGSNLVRQSSSPAGFLNGFSLSGEMGNYKVQSHQEAASSTSGLNNHLNFSSGPSSSFSFMPSIPETGNKRIDTHSAANDQLRNGEASTFGNSSWNESSFGSLKRNADGDLKNSSGLVHHLSLPKTASEMANVEKFLQFQQDTVSCQIRAKRGCATHPRSIAERMRRTKITEKMKKLQDLFPNIDKQTNQADMLDLVVEFIKDLQKQVQTLTSTRSKCICSTKPQ